MKYFSIRISNFYMPKLSAADAAAAAEKCSEKRQTFLK